ncbi:Myosin heavy chain, partial [Intoshia linei]
FQKFGKLCGVAPTELSNAFLTPKLKVGREVIKKSQNADQAKFATEAISKAMYSRLFDFVIEKVNNTLDIDSASNSFIGILDIAGFEIFDENVFEQLNINYTNEKLQQLFNHTMFIKEQEEYESEGIKWNVIDFALESQVIIDLLERPLGLYPLLDEECWFPKATDKTYVEKIIKNHENNDKFMKPTLKQNCDFVLKHYAGDVHYTVSNWLMKNMDPLNENIVEILQNSSCKFVKKLWNLSNNFMKLSTASHSAGKFGASTKKGMFRTVSQNHRDQLSLLMNVLRSTSVHFVRCVIPNYERKSGKINAQLVLDQLRCNGIIEGIRIYRQGYPNRIPFQEFRQNYEILAPNILPPGFMDGKVATTKILEHIGIDASSYQLGQSKVFFRVGVLAQLEEDRDAKLTKILGRFIDHVRGYIVRKNLYKRQNKSNAIRIIQRNCANYLKLYDWKWWKLYTKVRPLLKLAGEEEVLREKDKSIAELKDISTKQKDELDMIKSNNEKLYNENQDINHKLKHLEQTLEDANKTKEDMENYMASLDEQIELNESNTKKMEKSLAALKEDISDYKELLELREVEQERLSTEKNNIQNRLNELNENLSSSKDSNSKVLIEKNNLEEMVVQLNTELDARQDKIKNLTKNKNKQENAFAELSQQYDEELKLRKDYETKLKKLENEIKALKIQLEKCEEELRIANSTNDRLKQEIKQLNTKIEDESKVLFDANNKLADKERENSEILDDFDTERTLRKRVEGKCKNLLEELEGLKSVLEDTSGSVDAQTKISNQKDNEIARLIECNESEKKEYESHLSNLKSKYNGQLNESNDENQKLKKANTELEKKYKLVYNECEEFRIDLDNTKKSKGDSDKNRRNIESQLQESKNKIEDLSRDVDSVKTTLAKTIENLDKANVKIDELQTMNQNLEKINREQKSTIDELEDKLEAEVKSKQAIEKDLRDANMNLTSSTEMLDAESDNIKLLKSKIEQFQVSMKKLTEENEKNTELIEEMDENQRKQLKNIAILNEDKLLLKADIEKVKKAKKHIESQFEDKEQEIQLFREDNSKLNRLQKKFDSQTNELKIKCEKLLEEKEQLEKDNRAKETKLLNNNKLLAESEEKLTSLSSQIKQNQIEIDGLLANQNSSGKNEHELRKQLQSSKMELENEIARAEDLEDEIQLLTDAKMRLGVNYNALKQQNEKNAEEKDEEFDNRIKSYTRKTHIFLSNLLFISNTNIQINELEEILVNEKKIANNANNTRRITEEKLNQLENETDRLKKQKDDVAKSIKKIANERDQYIVKNEELKKSNDSITEQLQKSLKTIKSLEDENNELESKFTNSNKHRKNIEIELSEIEENSSAILAAKNALSEENKKLSTKLTELEDELEEEQENGQTMQSRLSKLKNQYDTANKNLERTILDLEESESNLEKSTKKIKSLSEELENLQNNLVKQTKQQLVEVEFKLKDMSDKYDKENSEKNTIQKSLRKSEKKTKELNLIIEDDKSEISSLKQQWKNLSSKLSTIKTRLYQTEEALETEQKNSRRIARELNELEDRNMELDQMNAKLKSKR